MKRVIFQNKTPYVWRGEGKACLYQIERKEGAYILLADGAHMGRYNVLIEAMHAAEVDNQKK